MTPRRQLLFAALWLQTTAAIGQTNVGELLDAGGKRLLADEFKRELVDRSIVGVTPAGFNIEVVYTSRGDIRGVAAASVRGGATGGAATFAIEGSWTFDDSERVCESIPGGRVMLPARCQYWYKHDRRYFIADSDTDRSARVIVRTRKE